MSLKTLNPQYIIREVLNQRLESSRSLHTLLDPQIRRLEPKA